MNAEEHDLVIRRILVALDASSHSLTALEAAADLAARFGADLLGLFVEDVNLLRLAELPFAQEIGLFSATRRALEPGQVTRQFRAQATRSRQALTTTAERAQVTWTFRVTRGVVVPELLVAASEADLLILGKAGWSLAGGRRLGSTARAVLAAAPCPALILQHGVRPRVPVLVVYDGSPLARKTLAAAAGLLEDEADSLTVLILAEELATGRELQDRAAAQLQTRGVRARYRLLTESTASRLAHLARLERCGTLVLPASDALLHDEALLDLLNETRMPVLLVR